MSQNDLIIYGIAALAFIAIVGIGLALSSSSSEEAARKRAKQVAQGTRNTGTSKKDREDNTQRRKETQRMLSKLREDDAKRKKSLVPQDMGAKLQQAGLSISPTIFWIISGITGVVFAFLTFLSGADGVSVLGFEINSRIGMIVAAGLAGSLGLPRWILGFLAKSRTTKMIKQFGDGLDVIVRGVKSGLPLNECLQIIARESPAPLGPEFTTLTDSIAMGTNLERSLQNLYRRVPLPEINFFVIVLAIQSKAGGNLSEALGNLSSVIRQRRMMREKVKALSSEAKASAAIIGCLPFAVGLMVFFSTPDYIMQLFITETGHSILFTATCFMAIGIFVMRRMINFDM